jgi:hypothetical protein
MLLPCHIVLTTPPPTPFLRSISHHTVTCMSNNAREVIDLCDSDLSDDSDDEGTLGVPPAVSSSASHHSLPPSVQDYNHGSNQGTANSTQANVNEILSGLGASSGNTGRTDLVLNPNISNLALPITIGDEGNSKDESSYPNPTDIVHNIA